MQLFVLCDYLRWCRGRAEVGLHGFDVASLRSRRVTERW